MIDLKVLRENPEIVRASQRARGEDEGVVDSLLSADERRRSAISRADTLRAEQRVLGKEVGKAKGEEKTALLVKAKDLAAEVKAAEAEQNATAEEVNALLAKIPNLVHPDAPVGGEDDFVVVKTVGKPREFDFDIRDHVEIGEALGLIDIPRAVKVSGSRFAYLTGQAVLLELALVRYALDLLGSRGFTPVIPPVLTREEALYGTAFLPTGADQLYRIPEDDLYLVGTSEVPLAGLHMDEILAADDLPLRYAGFSTCFRREAGTYGKDTRGIFRVHQFDKVEMFSFVSPDESWDEHERLRATQEDILTGLGLHGRVVDIAVGDLGSSAARKYDLEVWIPGQDAYRELTSASNCTDYQARRLRCRYRVAEGETAMVHTLNGTAVAVGRTLIALLETHQRPDGTVAVPEPLQAWFGSDHLG